MTLEEFSAYCLSKPGVTQDAPMKGEVVWMKVGGKIFAMTNVRALNMEGVGVPPFHFINLKCEPERAVALRNKYPAIEPAWHQNKRHWNTLLMGQSLANALIKKLTDHSYDLVAASLTKRQRGDLGL